MAMALALCNAETITPTRQRLADVNPDGVKYFMEKLLLQIYEHFDKQELIDVSFKLSSPNALVTAHRLILSASSPYFRELFKSEQGICPLIEIDDIDSETFERLITFCYTGKTLTTVENVDRMLKAALTFQLQDAVTNCVDFLIEHINDYTLERAYALDSEIQCTILTEKIMQYEINNFMNIIKSPNFLNFDASKLQKILENDDLNAPSEEAVFEAVKRWYEHDAATRKQYLPDIIACLRLTHFDTNYLLANIQPLPGCEFIVLKALSWVNIPLTRTTISLKFINPRTRWGEYSTEPTFLALNLTSPAGEPRNIFQYNKIADSWLKWIDIKTDVLDFRVVFMNENLYFIGGNRKGQTLNEVKRWNFTTKTFQQLDPMNQPRYRHTVVALNEKIYAIGGEEGFGIFALSNKIFQSVEMYTAANGWKVMSSMTAPRSGAAAVTLNGKIYVMGGSAGFINALKTVECYDPVMNCWTKCADMNESHNNPGATVHNGYIFVVGGWDGKHFKTAERYNPLRDEWTQISPLSIGRGGIGCISIDNQLWAIGGSDIGYKDCVSVYDEQNDKWIDKQSMPLAANYYCFSVPRDLLKSVRI